MPENENEAAEGSQAGPAPAPGADAEPRHYERVLVVSAHPDDPEFSAGAAIAKLAAEGAEVYYCICTDGSQGGEDPAVPDIELSQRRYAEQRDAAAVLGVKDVTFLGYKDGHLAADLTLRKAITAEIRRRRPDLVITHSPLRNLQAGIGASHPDHLAVGEATLGAVYPDARNPRAYRELLDEGLPAHTVREVWVTTGDDVDHFVELDPELVERKLESLRAHASQFEKEGRSFDREDGPAKWVTDRMRRMGERGGFQYAEAFKRIETG